MRTRAPGRRRRGLSLSLRMYECYAIQSDSAAASCYLRLRVHVKTLFCLSVRNQVTGTIFKPLKNTRIHTISIYTARDGSLMVLSPFFS